MEAVDALFNTNTSNYAAKGIKLKRKKKISRQLNSDRVFKHIRYIFGELRINGQKENMIYP